VADALAAQGMNEIVGWSFTGPEVYERLRIEAPRAVEIANPLSGDQSQLRTILLGSLLDAAARNRAHGASIVRLFETGAVYLPADNGPLPREPFHVAVVIAGAVRSPTWRDPEPPQADFFAIKGALARMFGALRIEWEVEQGGPPFLHPGRAATIRVGGAEVGWLGELHPSVADQTAAFEVDLDAIGEPSLAVYEDVTSFPAVREDLAVVVGEHIPAAEVLAVVRDAGAPLLAAADVFDVYRDPGRIGADKVSLALRLTYQAADRTLTDEEVAAKRKDITTALESGLGGVVRAS
jgi:phenylalanyl-tRNA synthetase beta chain